MKRNLTLSILGCAALLAAGANANTFVTPSGATTSGGAVDASATFTTGAGSLTIVLTDLEANPTDVAQLISDLSFGFNRTISSTGISISSAIGAGINILANGATSVGTVPAGAWAVDTGFHITALGGGQPKGLIIGPGPYSNANGSIAANDPHNPFFNQTATFVLSIPGLLASDVVNSATFSFGTTPGIDVPGTSVPDGGTTVLLLGAALSGLGLIRRKLS